MPPDRTAPARRRSDLGVGCGPSRPELRHRRLYVGKLDEQHPWLYDARSLTRHGIAEEYRQRILRERGVLRGADFIMMRELVQAQEALARVRAARSVAEQFQALPEAAQAIGHEPRLVRVGAARNKRESVDADESRAHAARPGQ